MTFPILWLPGGEQNLYNFLNIFFSLHVVPLLIFLILSGLAEFTDSTRLSKESKVRYARWILICVLALFITFSFGVLPFLLIWLAIIILKYSIYVIASAFGKPLE